ncbi:MAG: HAD family hydrolase [Acidobacteriota bacterium]|nr:HAD family hydrolase [Acidobacteriota bacterium]
MPSFAVQGILFDLDGVLINSTAGVGRVWRDWAVRHGRDPEQTEHTAHGRPAIETVRLLAPELDAEAELADLERREIADSYDVTAFSGAAELLQTLPAGQWAIVTSGTRPLATHRLQVAGLPVPEWMITGSDIQHGKPHPEPYLRGAKLLGLEPAQCTAFEDAPSGIRSARAAGMSVLGLPTTYPISELGEATALVPALAKVRVRVAGGLIHLEW